MSTRVQCLNYEYLQIENKKTGRKIDISNSVICSDYYEDMLQGYLVTTLFVQSTYNIVSELPLRTGFHEMVAMKYSTPSGTFTRGDLDGSGDVVPETGEMYVYKVTGLDTQRQAAFFTIHLVSREAIVDHVTECRGCYKEKPIDQHVRHILKNVIKTKKKCDIDKINTSYKFWANNKKPFHTIQWLGPKCMTSSISGSEGKEGTLNGKSLGVGGALFFERQDGFCFKTLDSLVSDTKISEGSSDLKDVEQASYSWTGLGGVESGKESGNFRILKQYMEKNTDLRKALNFGVYANKTTVFNPESHLVTNYIYRLKDEIKNNTLGDEDMIDVPVENVSRTIVKTTGHGFSGNGENGLGDSGRDRTDDAKSGARYNLLLSSQVLSIEVPCNVKLQVGDIIKCEFPRLREGKADEVDQQHSGKWLIKELCHHFQVNKNITAMKLIRDSYGFSKSKSTTEKLIEKDNERYGDTFPEGSFNITN